MNFLEPSADVIVAAREQGGGHYGQLSLGPLTTYLLPLHLLLQGSFCQEEVKQSYCKDAQNPCIMHTLLEDF